jgi:HD-GYP domain-containing protein (c-di-GMP phosphodiesterase class II)
VLLTGQAEMDAAIAAVNEGQIFRFLTKPCPSERLIEAVAAAGEQNRLLLAERVLLEQTLQGSIKTLTDILSLNNPLAFGRAARVKQHVTALAERAGVKERWPIEVAAMLAPIGTVTLPPEVVEKLYQGGALTSAEEAMVKRVPAVTEQLLANIPRLEPVREILLYQHARFDGEGGTRKGADLPIGSRLLKLVTDFDVLETQGTRRALALDTLRSRRGWYDPELLAAINALLGSAEQQVVVEEVSLSGLVPGMCFAEDVRSREGALLIARGHEVTPSLIERIRNFSRNVGVREPLKMIRRAR